MSKDAMADKRRGKKAALVEEKNKFKQKGEDI